MRNRTELMLKPEDIIRYLGLPANTELRDIKMNHFTQTVQLILEGPYLPAVHDLCEGIKMTVEEIRYMGVSE